MALHTTSYNHFAVAVSLVFVPAKPIDLFVFARPGQTIVEALKAGAFALESSGVGCLGKRRIQTYTPLKHIPQGVMLYTLYYTPLNHPLI